MAALEHALSLAEPGGYVRIFIDEGEAVAQLLDQAAVRRIAPGYTTRLLAAFESEDPRVRALSHLEEGSAQGLPGTGVPGWDAAQAGREPGTPWVEPLSEREQEVLRLLPSRLSTPEIAQELVISVHTVRSHVKTIYGKLGVHRRADAVRRAEETGLL